MRIEIKNLNKSFSDKHILHDVSFAIESGRAMGFLGRNGSGKTTTIRCLMDIFKPDSGQILVDGKPFLKKDYRIGYLPEERGMYAKSKIIDQLVYFARLKGAGKNESEKSVEEWLERFELAEYAKANLETLSKGNQQKIQIIQAFLNNPDMIILDEPFSGLDPVNSELFKETIREEIKKGKLVIFSSHQMSYVEEFCDDITLINQGRILINDSLAQVKESMGIGKYRLKLKNMNEPQSRDLLRELASVNVDLIEEDQHSLIIPLAEAEQKDFLVQLMEQDIQIETFSAYQPALTDIFIKLVKESDNQLATEGMVNQEAVK